ncbi:hypothetical protein FOG18_05765 [Legionella israelensis]|uniref:hypothetical protein n=1 Tax=Legionella israelensis TaxID=454 RepID=UPI00117CA423|nr:hypothetical protein [Legionella israelensis]QDP72109.1 hypothetical protein FOG18_05765 [Legionella israelensis]
MKTFCIFLSFFLYVISLFLPSAVIPNFERGFPETIYGYEILVSGWMGLISLQPAWLANPVYIIELLTYGSVSSYRLGVAAIILALFSPFILTEKLLAGYYIWLFSFVILAYGNYLHSKNSEHSNLH